MDYVVGCRLMVTIPSMPLQLYYSRKVLSDGHEMRTSYVIIECSQHAARDLFTFFPLIVYRSQFCHPQFLEAPQTIIFFILNLLLYHKKLLEVICIYMYNQLCRLSLILYQHTHSQKGPSILLYRYNEKNLFKIRTSFD